MSPEGKDAADGRPSRSVLNPRDALIITRTKLQDTLDDAVRRGRMTRDDAADLLAEIIRRADGALSAPADVVRRVTGAADPFPIEHYDDLTAAEVNAHLGALDAGGLRR